MVMKLLLLVANLILLSLTVDSLSHGSRMRLMNAQKSGKNMKIYSLSPEVIRETIDEGISSSLFLADVTQFGINTALAEEHIELGNHADAERLSKEAMEISKHTGEDNNIYAAYAEGILADSLYHMGSYKEAAEHYHSALKTYERHSKSSHGPEAIELVGAVQLVAWSLLSSRKYEEAKGACSAALAMTEKLTGPMSIDVGASLLNLAIANMHTGDLGPRTEALFHRSLKIYQHSMDKISTDENTMKKCRYAIGALYSSRGNLYYLRGDMENAEKSFLKVEQLYMRGVYNDIDAAAPLKNLGMIYWKRGLVQRAELALGRAMLVVESAPGYGTVNPEYKSLKGLLEKLRNGAPAPM